MKSKTSSPSQRYYGIGCLVISVGLLFSILLCALSGAGRFPTIIRETFGETRQRLTAPGEREVTLTRTGVYGIYFEYNPRLDWRFDEDEAPLMLSDLECTLTSKSTGEEIVAAPDYVAGNRYEDHDRVGILIMSLDIDDPGAYTFACQYQDSRAQPQIVVLLGPNYGWEVLKLFGKTGLPLLGALVIFCGAALVGSLIILIVAILRYTARRQSAH